MLHYFYYAVYLINKNICKQRELEVPISLKIMWCISMFFLYVFI